MQDRFEVLHDCALREIVYGLSDPKHRRLVFVLDCPKDMGDDEWNGKRLFITAEGIFYFQYTGWAHTVTVETLDTWRRGVSMATDAELQRAAQSGLIAPNERFTVVFHSGSCMELVCENLVFRVDSAKRDNESKVRLRSKRRVLTPQESAP
jgi:hypothetical protein